MPLTSKTFTRDPKVRARLERCATNNADHIYELKDPVGDHVSAIQAALVSILGFDAIKSDELEQGRYGTSTQQAVFKFKNDGRLNGTGKPLLFTGQTTPDHVVGIQTIAALDREVGKREPGPPPPPPPPPPPDPPSTDKFKFFPIKAPLLIKSGLDDPSKQDLENAPVKRLFAIARSRFIVQEFLGGSSSRDHPTVDNCKRLMVGIISRGGSQATEMAQFFFLNQQQPPTFFRVFDKDHFWVQQVRGDKSFTKNQAALSQAIQDALQELADGSPLQPRVVDINKLEDGSSFQPKAFADFQTDIDFSFQRDFGRFTSGNPLAFGIGSIQGLEVRITSFQGNPDGSYQGQIQYVLLDHFGSDDSDVVDPGQGSLWLLQRKMADGQTPPGFEPFRVKIIVNDVAFSGQLK